MQSKIRILSKMLLLFVLFLLPIYKGYCIFEPITGIEDAQIKRIAISSVNKQIFYVASVNSLYKSNNYGQTFEKVAVFKDEVVNHIFFDSYSADGLYVVSSRHLYKITDKTEKLFSSPEETILLSAAKLNGMLYLGTSTGLYRADENLLNWQEVKGLHKCSVYSLVAIDDKLYMATAKGVYILSKDNLLERIFALRDSSQEGEEEKSVTPNIIKADIFNKERLWLGTTRGIFLSSNAGKSWDKFYVSGLSDFSVYCLTQTNLEENTIYLGTNHGFFRVNLATKTSQNIFEGLAATDITWAEIDFSGAIYLATTKGLFKNSYFSGSQEKQDVLAQLLTNEPAIEDIQQVALQYNEANPEKIKQWRRNLKFRALFPEVSLDYDKTITTALGATYDRVQIGPQDWGVNLKWDVGDLIWNTYENDVDTRSRLNTQLRLDVLDEINRVYFERLRLKHQLQISNLASQETFNSQLRLKELTAILDGYTGGYFSKKSNQLARQ